MKLRLLSATAALAGLIAAPASAQFTIGTSNGQNCFPFGCQSGTSTRYQQVYRAGAFSGPVSITSVAFRNPSAGTLNEGTFQMYLSTTTLGLNVDGPAGISSVSFDANRGADNVLFATLVIPSGSTATQVYFSGAAFSYNPGAGNLLVDIVSNITTGGSASLEAMNGGSADFSRVHDFGTAFEEWGLVTDFNGRPNTVVPEPGTVVLMGSGLVALVAAARRKR
ncbi:MAG: PEP-CTERM sorting domain-containing protein [Gemmatimonadales bacterium]|nr:PEP-CTERM sorting domain-containing protein [Gemmatimonadales bacterium]